MDVQRFVEAQRRRDRAEQQVRQQRAQRVRARLGELAYALAQELGARRVILFGSLLGGELYPDSDVDIAVEGLGAADYFRALDLAAKTLGADVDIVRMEEAPASLVDRIRREGEVLHG